MRNIFVRLVNCKLSALDQVNGKVLLAEIKYRKRNLCSQSSHACLKLPLLSELKISIPSSMICEQLRSQLFLPIILDH